jgi:hypothetical protein
MALDFRAYRRAEDLAGAPFLLLGCFWLVLDFDFRNDYGVTEFHHRHINHAIGISNQLINIFVLLGFVKRDVCIETHI